MSTMKWLAGPLLLASLAAGVAPRVAFAQEAKPISLGLVTPIQIVPEDQAISGVRLSLLYGRNAGMTGFDWSLIANHTVGDFEGIGLAAVNVLEGNGVGGHLGVVNYAKGAFRGLQWGAVNYAGQNRGLQLAFVNYAESINGIQIGLINIIKEGGLLPVMIIANWGFEN